MSQAAINHAERAHALLSASAAHRWLVCTPSARLEETLPERTSQYAESGRLAHEMAELKLRKYFTEPMGPRKFSAQFKKMREQKGYSPELERIVDAYVEFCQQVVHGFASPPYVTIEQRVDYSHVAPEGFGTADFIAIGGGVLHLVDLKTGQGKPVSIVDNPQLKLYALGALRRYSLLYPVETVRLSIVQPLVYDEPQTWETTAAELLAWAEEIKPIAAKAYAGEGEYVIGPHCDFCRARERCRARIEQYFDAATLAPHKPPIVSWDEVGDILRRAEGIVGWFNDLKELALQHVLEGGNVDGWKAVEGRGSRQYADLDKAFAHLTASGIDEALLYERKPLTPAALEKTLGKQQYRDLLEAPGYVVKMPGKPTLAPADDQRPAYNAAAAVFGAADQKYDK
jgi:hypothetical protein